MTAIPQQTQACPYGTGRLLLFTTAAVVARISTHSLPAQWPWSSMAVAAIAIAVWHGAFDGVLAEELFGHNGECAGSRPSMSSILQQQPWSFCSGGQFRLWLWRCSFCIRRCTLARRASGICRSAGF